MANPNEPDDELAGTEQPFVQHLIELRDRLIRASLAVLVCFGVLCLYPGPSHLYDLLAQPLVAHLPAGSKLIATNVISPFLVPMKITLLAGFMLALPVVLYQVWAFVAPGLYSHEKRLVLPLVVSSTLLFFFGVAFCYFFVFGRVFTFIQQFAPTGIEPHCKSLKFEGELERMAHSRIVIDDQDRRMRLNLVPVVPHCSRASQ